MGIVSSNKPVTFSPIYKSLHASNFIVKLSVVALAVNRLMPLTVVNLLNLSLRANLSFSNVSITKDFISLNYCYVTLLNIAILLFY